MALTYTENITQAGAYTIQVITLAGVPQPGQVIDWTTYGQTLTKTVAFESLDTLGYYVQNQTNAQPISFWQTNNGYTLNSPVGFPVNATYTLNTNQITFVLNQSDVVDFSISQITTPTPTPTPSPTPTSTPTSTGGPSTTLYMSGSNIGSGTQGIVTFWTDACGEGTQIASAVGDPWNALYNIPGGALNFTPTQLAIGIGLEIPFYTSEVWIQTTNQSCPTCHGPYPVDTIWATPTPEPTVTPTPMPTNNATSTPTPTSTPPPMINYRISECIYGLSYNVPKTNFCVSGTLTTLADPGLSIGDTVRFIEANNSTDCASGAPSVLCGVVTSTNYYSSHQGTDAIMIHYGVSSGGCTDIIHCPQP